MAWEAGYRDVGWKLSPTCPLNIPSARNRHSGKMETAKPGHGNCESGKAETVVPAEGNRLRRSRAYGA